MVVSSSCVRMPSPTERAPCGSKSTSSTLRPYSARAAPRLMVVVVLPTPPFWLHMAMMRAGPWLFRVGGSWNTGIGRPVAPTWPSPRSPGPGRWVGDWSVAVSVASITSEVTGAPLPAPSFTSVSLSLIATTLAASTNALQGRVICACRGVAGRGRQGPLLEQWATGLRLPSPGPGVRLSVDLAQPLHGHQGVDLGRGHARVPEQLL